MNGEPPSPAQLAAIDLIGAPAYLAQQTDAAAGPA